MIGKLVPKSALFLLVHNVGSAFCVFCTYWDAFHRQYRSTYCPHACCLTAYSIEDSCCFGWSWWITVMTIAFPIIISFIVFIVLCLLFKRRRTTVAYPRNGVIMYVDPRRANFRGPPGSSLFPTPPPNYNESNAAAAATRHLEENQRQLSLAKTGENGRPPRAIAEGDATTSSQENIVPKLPNEPPAYNSVVSMGGKAATTTTSSSVLTLSPRVFIRSDVNSSNDILEMNPVTSVNETTTTPDTAQPTPKAKSATRRSNKSVKGQKKQNQDSAGKKERDRSHSRSSLRSLRLTSSAKRDDEEHLNDSDQNEDSSEQETKART